MVGVVVAKPELTAAGLRVSWLQGAPCQAGRVASRATPVTPLFISDDWGVWESDDDKGKAKARGA